ncbi:MAG: PQQ-binding-like beta-propeller repeat protein [Pirellulales bacterium]
MSLTIDQFIDAAANVGLLPPEVIASLRNLVRDSQGQAQSRHLAKWLVDNKHLTPFQAKELLAGNLKAVTAASPNDELSLVEDEELDILEDEPLEEYIEEDNLEVVPDATIAEGIKAPRNIPAAPPPASGTWAQPARPAAPPPAAQRPAAPPPGANTGYAPPPGAVPAAAPPGYGAPPGAMPPGGPQPFAGAPGMPMQSVRPPTTARLGSKKKKKGGAWDSPLLMIGGGSLLLMLIFGAFLWWRIGRGSSDEALKQAEDEYGKNSYQQAVNLYDSYLKNFPQDKGNSIARVHRGLAQMRLAVDGTSNYSKALAVSKQILTEIETEKEFGQAEGELNSMLTKIADGLKERARTAPTQELVDQCQEALSLVNRYVPKAKRQVERIQDIERSLALATRELERSTRREEGLRQINEAVSSGQPEQAYAIRNELLKTYPDLAVDQGLHDAIVIASQAERSKVVFVEETTPAQDGDRPSPLAGEIVLAPRSDGTAEGVDAGRIAFVLAEGAAYGLEAATGKVLWRKFVGFDTNYIPQAAGAAATGDALLVDSVSNEIVRIEAATGTVRWRHPLDEPIVEGPVLMRSRALVALRSGRMVSLNLEDGSAANRVQLPQTVRTTPMFDSRQRVFYQVGDHANVYIFSVESNRCEDVYYTGHASGSIVTPPVVMGPYVILCENTGVASSTLHVLLVNGQGLDPREVQKVTVDGHILTPPMAAGKNLMVITDKAGFYAFEVNTPDQEPALVEVAKTAATANRSLVRHLLLRNAQFWVADNQLSKYDVQVVQGKLSPKWIKHERDLFLSRPQVAGDCLICSRRQRGVPGVTVSAVRMADGSSAWNLQLGAALACPPIVDDSAGQLTLLSGAGSLFQTRVTAKSVEQILDKPAVSAEIAEGAPGHGRLTEFSGGKATLTLDAPAERYLYIDSDSAKRLPWVKARGTLTGLSTNMAGKLLAASREGPLLLTELRNGAAAAEPFVPPLQAGSSPVWNALVPAGDNQVLAADGANKLYLLELQDSPAPHLTAAREVSLTDSITSPLAVLDGQVYGVDAQDRLVVFQLADLSRAGEQQLAGKATWGPRTVGSLVLLATAEGELLAFQQGKQLWRTMLTHGPLSGSPIVHDGRILLTATQTGRGTLYSLSAEDGQETGHLELGRPAAGGPVPIGKLLAIAGHDGTQYLVEPGKLSRDEPVSPASSDEPDPPAGSAEN